MPTGDLNRELGRERREQIIDYLRFTERAMPYPPSVAEIANYVRVCKSVALHHIRILLLERRIECEDGPHQRLARTWRLAPDRTNLPEQWPSGATDCYRDHLNRVCWTFS